jgi:hypothetical protein
VLFEPCLGAAPDDNLCDPWSAQYGAEIENAGFTSVRLRIDMASFTANSTGAYPDQSLTSAFFDGPGGLTAIVDELLARRGGAMYVMISPKGLESGTANDEVQMTKWWAEIADHYKNYTHRLIFNLMNEPLIRAGEFTDLATVQSLYQSLTSEIRKTNPTRYLIYYHVRDEFVSGGLIRERTPFSDTGPGESDFTHLDLNAIDHRGYLILDAHFLGSEDALGNGEGKRDERIRQAWEYRIATGYPVWSGAWNWGAWDTSFDTVELGELADLMKAKGVPGTYLMFNSTNTSLYDGTNTDRDGDGIFNEWTRPEYPPIIVSRNPIVWNAPAADPTTLYAPRHDGYAWNGGTPDLQARTFQVDANAVKIGYLKFDVNRLPPGVISSAKLYLKAQTANGDVVGVYRANDSFWDESDADGNPTPALLYATRPGFDPAPLASATVSVGDNGSAPDVAVNAVDPLDPAAYSDPSWTAFDVTAAITGEGTYSFAIVGTSGAQTNFWSRDSDGSVAGVGTWKYYPRLVVTVGP